MQPFEPHPLLRNPHAMTIAASFAARKFPRVRAARWETRLFQTEPETQLLAACAWQAERAAHPTLVLVHGLEGSIESNYMLGCAEKALAAGCNVVRVNQRNCGGSERLTPTLYNSGLSGDYCAIAAELAERDGLREIYLAGFSMGGNLVLKAAGEFGTAAPTALRGVAGVCPSLDLAACADYVDAPRNLVYRWNFVKNLKKRFRAKQQLYPGKFVQLRLFDEIRTIREFDDWITAPNCGYRDAEDYYYRASALRVIDKIAVPTLLLTAQDDPLIPYPPFLDPAVAANRHITLADPPHGGHCGFISRHDGNERFWAEARIIEFCLGSQGVKRSGSREIRKPNGQELDTSAARILTS